MVTGYVARFRFVSISCVAKSRFVVLRYVAKYCGVLKRPELYSRHVRFGEVQTCPVASSRHVMCCIVFYGNFSFCRRVKYGVEWIGYVAT